MPARAGLLDLLVAGGEVIDPATGRRGRYDVGLAGGRIAVVEPDVPRQLAAGVFDAAGCLVLPGLVDLHTHIFHGATFWGTDPRPLAWRTGVTTWVDAGSAGAYSAAALEQMSPGFAPLQMRAFLNISAVGLIAETGECRREDLCDPGLCAAVLAEHEGFFAGVKCRMDSATVGEMGIEPLRRALRAAEAAGVPVMVHIGAEPPSIDEVLDLLRPGDIVTHCMTSQTMSLLAPRGGIRRSVVGARERGVLFDVGHGSGSFSFSVAEAMLAAGFPPDVISSDAHQRSILGPCFDLPTCMSKFLALGMGLDDVVRAATSAPALAFSDAEAGSLEVGRRADLAVFQVEEGDFDFFDSELEARRAGPVLVNRATFAAGSLLEPVEPSRPAPWVHLTDAQRALLSRGPETLRRPWAGMLRSRDGYVSYRRSSSSPSARS